MKLILLATGLVVAAVGGWLMFDGWGIIQVERGWASFMAGSVLLSGGLLLAGLSAVVAELSRLRADGALPYRAEVARGDPKQDEAPAGARAPEAFEPVAPTPSAARVEARLAPGMAPASAALPAPSPAAAPALASGRWPAFVPPPDADRSAPPKPTLRPVLPQAPSRADPEAGLLAPTPAGKRGGIGFEWLEKAIKRTPEAAADLPPQEPAPQEPAAQEPAAKERAAQERANEEAASDEPSRVSRRFESHGVKYNLFQDGRIEAEADGRMHSFASPAELRVFLDTRMKEQDSR